MLFTCLPPASYFLVDRYLVFFSLVSFVFNYDCFVLASQYSLVRSLGFVLVFVVCVCTLIVFVLIPFCVSLCARLLFFCAASLHLYVCVCVFVSMLMHSRKSVYGEHVLFERLCLCVLFHVGGCMGK